MNIEKMTYRWMALGCMISYGIGLLWLMLSIPSYTRLMALAVQIVGAAAYLLAEKGSCLPMNCCKCGKQLPAGVVLCLACEKDLERVPDESIRLGYYARHPEALAELLILANSGDDLALSVCQSDCVDDLDADVDCTDEKFAACIIRWLLEPITEEDKHGYE